MALEKFSTVFVLLVFVSYPSQIICTKNQSEFFTLMKSSLSGNALSTWNVSGEASYCNFTGVSCDDRGYVETINMSAWSVSGTFPPGICSYLPELRVLDLSHHNNNLRGNFINSVANCSLLEELYMVSVYLSASLPDFSNMKSLRYLDMSQNRFTSDFPMSIINLTNLEEVAFHENFALNQWRIPVDIDRLTKLKFLDFSSCMLYGQIPPSIGNMTLLTGLYLPGNQLSGQIPDFSNMKYLGYLCMSQNRFTGNLPMSITNLTNLEDVAFNENFELNQWRIPVDIDRLTKLKFMDFSLCMLYGQIPPSIGNMTSLIGLYLQGNQLSGQVPAELGQLKNLKGLYLYNNSKVSGSIPDELGNLTELRDLDMSNNSLIGSIPESICRLPKLQALLLYKNNLTGEIPSAIAESTTLTELSLYGNFLTGQVPQNLGRFSPMVVLELSENHLAGPLPVDICQGGKLMYFLVLDNMFSGQIPGKYADCKLLLRFRISKNHLEGKIPEGLLDIPHASIIDLSDNKLTGPFPIDFGNARNLSELFVQNNKISGILPPEISQATNLVKIDLSNNLLSGPIPSEIGNLTKLNYLLLQSNKLDSSIPNSLSLLQSTSLLNLSNNLLTGNIPESLSRLLPRTTIDFASNNLSGPIPPLFLREGLVESLKGNPGLCVQVHNINFPICPQAHKKKTQHYIWIAGLPAIITIITTIAGVFLFLKRRCNKTRAVREQDDETLSSIKLRVFCITSFHKREILKSLTNENIIGQGGSGTVYKIKLSSGEFVAVKRLWGVKTEDLAAEDGLFWDNELKDRELKAEIEILGSVRHRNIVKLYSCFLSLDCCLLVYEYLPNGNLWEALHNGLIHLDWPTRRQIALGVAESLAYLHHDLPQPIIHRDIKPTNIILDVDYRPKIADFGIAKVLQASGGNNSTTTVVTGTIGYMAPEYSLSNKATTKGDVYSFGVVLMELITGKKPVEVEFGDYQNIVDWVSIKVETPEGAMEVIDKRFPQSFRFEVIRVLHIAISCTNNNPTQRPTMNEVVRLLFKASRPSTSMT